MLWPLPQILDIIPEEQNNKKIIAILPEPDSVPAEVPLNLWATSLTGITRGKAEISMS